MGESNTTVAAVLQLRAATDPDVRAFTFLVDGEHTEAALTYRSLHLRALAIATALRNRCTPGDRVLLLYPAGLDFIEGLFGCFYAGVIAVPAYPPARNAYRQRLVRIAADAGPKVALTTRGVADRLIGQDLEPELQLPLLATDDIQGQPEWVGSADFIGDYDLTKCAFIQYTSGSTTDARGVVVTHANLMNNLDVMQEALGHGRNSVVGSWVPFFHDLGLIGGVLHPVHTGVPCVFMSPAHFAHQPLRWLRAISGFRITCSGAPNFAYELCARRATPEDVSSLDLSSWRVASVAAEPIRASTLRRFAEVYASAGFDERAFQPSYGLAEATLMVSGGTQPFFRRFSLSEIQAPGWAEASSVTPSLPGGIELVASGRPTGQTVAIVDPYGAEVQPGEVGEIWVAGPSVAAGYWNNPQATRLTFGGVLPGHGTRSFLRTGDLGCLKEGHLFVTGRIKDLLIVNGRNIYPQDIEETTEESSPHVIAGRGAAFSVPSDTGEELVIAYEINRSIRRNSRELRRTADAIRRAVVRKHEVTPASILLLRPNTAFLTSSGKIQRYRCREGFLHDQLDACWVWRSGEGGPAAGGAPRTPTEELLCRLCDDLLGVAGVGVFDDFFSLGGDSLLATQLMAEVSTRLSTPLPLHAVFEAPTIAELADWIDNQRVGSATETISRKVAPAGVVARAQQNRLALAPSQRGIWVLEQLAPRTSLNVILLRCELYGQVDPIALERSIAALTTHHDALRSEFHVAAEGPYQVVGTGTPRWKMIDLSMAGAREQEVALQDVIDLERSEGFDVSRSPLLRATLVIQGPAMYTLFIVAHHLIADGVSLSVLAQELRTEYAAIVADEQAPLVVSSYGYRDWVADQAGATGRVEDALRWWSSYLVDLPQARGMPTDRARSVIPDFSGSAIELELSAELTAGLRSLAQREGATLFTVLTSAIQLLVSRQTGDARVALGIPFANRAEPRTTRLVGCLVNILPLLATVATERSFLELVEETGEMIKRIHAMQHVSLEQIADVCFPGRGVLGAPIFDVVVDYLRADQLGLELVGVSSSRVEQIGEETKFPITLTIADRRTTLTLRAAYQQALFDGERITHLLRQLEYLLKQLVSAPGVGVNVHSLVTDGCARTLPDPRAPLATLRMSLIPDLFWHWVAKAPNSLAVSHRGVDWSYGQLGACVRTMADCLTLTLPKRGAVVGVLGSSCNATIASMLAVMAAGGTLLSLDRRLPPQRLKMMCQEAGVRLLLRVGPAGVDDAWVDDLEPQCIDVDAITGTPTAGGGLSPGSGLAEPVGQDDPAYVIFTTGTTSTPKGVLGRHRGIAHFLAWERQRFGIGATDRFVQLTNLAFDMALRDVFLPLTSGSALYLLDDASDLSAASVLPTLDRAGITVLHVVPTVAESWLLGTPAGRQYFSVRYVFFAGEPLSETLATRWRGAFPNALLVNLYGPTETTQSKCFFIVPDAPVAGVQPIGSPLPGAQALVLGGGGRLCGIGEVGEIVIRTPYRSLGYLNAPDENRRRFQANPFRDDADDIVFFSRDRGRYRLDGSLEILGRLDHLIKIRGTFVNPDDVTAELVAHPNVGGAIVIPIQNDSGQNRLVAYVVADRGTVSVAELRSHLGRRLLDAMVPSTFVFLPHLPMAPNGKVDRRALPPPAQSDGSQAVAHEPPRNALEERLAAIWAQTLGIESAGIHDNFFELGGHSLLALQLVTRIREATRTDLPLRRIFESPTIAGLAEALSEHSFSVGELGSRHDDNGLPEAEAAWEVRYEPFPLTEIQQAYWLGRNGAFELGEVAAHSYREFETADLDVERFLRAWQRLVERHDMLRMVVLPDGRQRVLEQVPPLEIPVLDLRGLAPLAAAGELAAVRQRMSHQMLAADRWPLFEVRVSLLEEGRSRLHLSMDALICDAWSRQVLVRELQQLYADPEHPLPLLGLTFRDYVLAERALRETDLYRRSRDYWLGRLASLAPAPELPLARSPAALGAPHFARRGGRLEASAWARLRERAARVGLTPSGILLAAFAEVLATWSKGRRFTVNLTLFNRLPLHPQVDDIIGDFTSLTLLEVDYERPEPFEARARRLQEQLWNDLDHRYYGGVQILRELARIRGRGPQALMPVVFTSALAAPAARAQDTRTPAWMGQLVFGISQTPQVWLDHQTYEEGGTLVFAWDAVEELFPQGLLDDMFDAYRQLLWRLAEGEDAWQDTTGHLCPSAHLARRAEANATDSPVPEVTLDGLFAAQATARPGEIAVVSAARTLTYGELDEYATRIARWLRQRGARPNSLVAVVMEKGWEQVAAVLGVLRAGAAYLPIDASLPPTRQRYLLDHGQAALALTQQGIDARLPWSDGVQRLCVDAGLPEDAHSPQAALDDVPAHGPDDLAYVIYTSGSTGNPKGVMINHRGAVNTILDVNRRFAVGPGDRVLAVSSLSFDLSVYDIFGLLTVGGTVVIPDAAAGQDPAHWATLLRREQITLWNSVPALLGLLLGSTGDASDVLPPSLRLVLLSGDWIPVSLPPRLLGLPNPPQVISLGGATEASIWSILYPIESVDPSWRSIPYGRPMANQRFHVYNAMLEPCPDWSTGQLYIGGVGLARGYWHDPDRTSASFITHPRTDERLYAAGDLGRYLPDGTIEFLGREDFQVKIRGHRIELGEIEATLRRHDEVADVLVDVYGSTEAEKRLIAYVILRSEASATAHELRLFVADMLPQYMIPSSILFLNHWPLSANGKVDRRALPVPDHGVEAQEGPRVMPSTILERAVAQAWSAVLETVPSNIDIDTNFFDLGATSLNMIEVQAKLRMSTAAPLQIVDLFRYPTIRTLAQHLASVTDRNPRRGTEDRAERQRAALRQAQRPTRRKRT